MITGNERISSERSRGCRAHRVPTLEPDISRMIADRTRSARAQRLIEVISDTDIVFHPSGCSEIRVVMSDSSSMTRDICSHGSNLLALLYVHILFAEAGCFAVAQSCLQGFLSCPALIFMGVGFFTTDMGSSPLTICGVFCNGPIGCFLSLWRNLKKLEDYALGSTMVTRAPAILAVRQGRRPFMLLDGRFTMARPRPVPFARVIMSHTAKRFDFIRQSPGRNLPPPA